jgi:hypothetical protein
VPLPSGGSLVIDQTEAIVTIDATAQVPRPQRRRGPTAFKTDMEAADEIPRQLKLRDMGGVIICDFIDLRFERHRREVEERLHKNLNNDRAKTRMLRMSHFGIIEMTRQRMRPSLKKSIYQECNACRAHGMVKTPESMSLDVMRKLRIAVNDAAVVRVHLCVHPEVALFLQNRKRVELAALEERSNKRVIITPDATLAMDEVKFELFDSRDGYIYIAELGMALPSMNANQNRSGPPQRGGRDRGRDQQFKPKHDRQHEETEAIDAEELFSEDADEEPKKVKQAKVAKTSAREPKPATVEGDVEGEADAIEQTGNDDEATVVEIDEGGSELPGNAAEPFNDPRDQRYGNRNNRPQNRGRGNDRGGDRNRDNRRPDDRNRGGGGDRPRDEQRGGDRPREEQRRDDRPRDEQRRDDRPGDDRNRDNRGRDDRNRNNNRNRDNRPQEVRAAEDRPVESGDAEVYEGDVQPQEGQLQGDLQGGGRPPQQQGDGQNGQGQGGEGGRRRRRRRGRRGRGRGQGEGGGAPFNNGPRDEQGNAAPAGNQAGADEADDDFADEDPDRPAPGNSITDPTSPQEQLALRDERAAGGRDRGGRNRRGRGRGGKQGGGRQQPAFDRTGLPDDEELEREARALEEAQRAGNRPAPPAQRDDADGNRRPDDSDAVARRDEGGSDVNDADAQAPEPAEEVVANPPPRAAARGRSRQAAKRVPPPQPDVVKTGSTDKHLADDEPIDTETPYQAPTSYADLDALPDYDE